MCKSATNFNAAGTSPPSAHLLPNVTLSSASRTLPSSQQPPQTQEQGHEPAQKGIVTWRIQQNVHPWLDLIHICLIL